jgi:hypothetical protein
VILVYFVLQSPMSTTIGLELPSLMGGVLAEVPGHRLFGEALPEVGDEATCAHLMFAVRT